MSHVILIQGISITNLLACRGCLATNRNLYNIHQNDLAKYFASLVGLPVSASDGLPQYLCYYCLTLINKFATFRTRCERAQNILLTAKLKGVVINTDYVKTIDRIQNNLCFPYAQAETENCSFRKKPKLLEVNRATDNIDHKYVDVVVNECNNCDTIIDNDHNSANNGKKYRVNITDSNYCNGSKNKNKNEDTKDLEDFFICNKEDNLNNSILFTFNESNVNDFDLNNDTEEDSTREYLICDFDEDSKSDSNSNTPNLNGETLNDTEISNNETTTMDSNLNNELNNYSDLNILLNSTNYRRELGDVIILNIDEINRFCKDRTDLKNNSEQDVIPKKIKYKPIAKDFKTRLNKKFGLRNYYNYNKREDIIKFEKTYHVKVSYLTRAQSRQDVEEKRKTKKYLQSKFPCQICYQAFKNENLYISHMAQHDLSRGKFMCEFCQCRFKRRSLLNTHMLTHVLRVSCNDCSHVARSYERAKHHYNWHMGFRFCCQYCGNKYGKSAGLYEHLRNAHVDKMCWCDKCGETFVGDTGLRWHMKRAHSEVNKPDPARNCSSCNTDFETVEALRTHIDSSPGLACNPDISSCVKCGENFETDAVLKIHYLKHKKIENRQRLRPYCNMNKREKRHMCEICGMKFVAFAFLKQHQRVHTGEEPFQCNFCSRKFKHASTFKMHIYEHTGELPFKCSICPKAYTSKAALKRHQSSHNTRNHVCTVCKKSFWKAETLKAHISTVHSEVELHPHMEANGIPSS